MHLVVDIGNTNLKIAIFDKKELIALEVYPLQDVNVTFLNQSKLQKRHLTKAYIGSVVPSKNHLVCLAIKNVFKLEAEIIKNKWFCDFFNLEKYDLNEIGSDILAAALYLQDKDTHSGAIIFGTATVGVAIQEREIVGVSIASNFENGIQKLLNQSELMKNGHSAKELRKNQFNFALGHNTITALTSGYSHSIYGFIMSFQQMLKDDYNINKIYVSGGNSDIIPKDIKHLIFDKEIVIKGYNLLTYNK